MGLTDYTISDKKYWQAGREYEHRRIIALVEKRLNYIRDLPDSELITAMQIPVDKYQAVAIIQATLFAIINEEE